MAKNILNQIDLDKSGESHRIQQLSKNNLLKSSEELNNTAEKIRNTLLGKNNEKESDSSVKWIRGRHTYVQYQAVECTRDWYVS